MTKELKEAIDKSYQLKIKVNKAYCLKCETVVESKYTHDFKFCRCKGIAVDGGKSYLKRTGGLHDYKDLSEYEGCSKSDCDGLIVFACVDFKLSGGWYCQKCYKEY